MVERIKKQSLEENSPAPSKDILCIYCRDILNLGALRCSHCNSYQTPWKNWLSHIPLIISFIMMLIAILQLVIASKQMNEAREKNITATVALNKAEDASKNLEKLINDVKTKEAKFRSVLKEGEEELSKIRLTNEFSMLVNLIFFVFM